MPQLIDPIYGKEQVGDTALALLGVTDPIGVALTIGMALAQGNPSSEPYIDPRDYYARLTPEERAIIIENDRLKLEEEAAWKEFHKYDPQEIAKREAYWKAEQEKTGPIRRALLQSINDAKVAKAKASYNPVQAQVDALNKQKIGLENQKAYQQKVATANAAQMAIVNSQNASVAAQTAQRRAAEAIADKADFTKAIETNITEQQKAVQEAQRIQKERTAKLSLALKTRLGVLDQQKDNQKQIQAQNIQLLSNQIKQQSDSQIELQKKQAAQALARKGIKAVGGRLKRKKSSMTY